MRQDSFAVVYKAEACVYPLFVPVYIYMRRATGFLISSTVLGYLGEVMADRSKQSLLGGHNHSLTHLLGGHV